MSIVLSSYLSIHIIYESNFELCDILHHVDIEVEVEVEVQVDYK
jgi:hypothetical protein